IAVREANKLGIPVIAIADTNADPDLIDYPIPGNDDAIRSVSVITKAIADAIESARKAMPEDVERDEGGVTYSTELGAQEVEERERGERPRRPKRRPKRRRPRPQAIAQVRGGDEAKAEQAEESAEGDEEE
ncbi:MAG: 30S ribosomal protein S2, partial [Gemmatimonadota bacterium]